ncbi:MAG: galactokinase, partial [Ileibacterium sp.]|nr:galactokinase [Ileibacterium sp.]
MLASELKKAFEDGQFDQMLKDLYLDESQLDWQKERYANACAKFIELYGDKPAGVFTA